MVNGIGSSSSSMSYLQIQSAKTKPDPAEMFKKVDTDGSGGVSQSELDALAEKISQKTGQSIDTDNAISTYDTDGDGELSSEELKSFMESTMQQGLGMMRMPGGPGDLFNALDTDSSGGVSETELNTWALNMSDETGTAIDTTDAISTYDTDGDGELSSTELETFLDASGIKPPPPPPPPSESSETDSSTSGAEGILSKYDTNGDGVLSSSELQAYLDETSVSSLNGLTAKAMSAYASTFDSSQTFNLQDFFMNSGGSGVYTPIDYSV